MRALLKLGADPCTNIYSRAEGSKRNHWTPFHLAFSLHFPNILKVLLEAVRNTPRNTNNVQKCLQLDPFGCALPFSSRLERYELHGTTVARERLLETVRLLGSNSVEASLLTGMTPLIQAIDFADLDVVSALVACYPDITRKFHDPKNPEDWILPVHFSAQLAGRSRDFDNAAEILALLVKLDFKGVNSTDNRDRTPLHFAATGNSPMAAKWLVENQGADVNVKDKRGCRPLHCVAAVSTASFLLSSGAILDARDNSGWTALHHLCKRGCLDVVNFLIERGALLGPNAHDGVMNAAILGKSHRIVSCLLRSGVSVRGTPSSNAGLSTLHVAMKISRTDIVQTLLDD